MNRRPLIAVGSSFLAVLAALVAVLTHSTVDEAPTEVGMRATSDAASPVGVAEAPAPARPTAAVRDEAPTAPNTVDASGAYSAVPGSRFEFDLETDSAVQFGETTDGAIGTALVGTQTTTVLARRDGELVVELTFDVRATIRGGAEGAERNLANELALPVLVKMKDDGSVLGLGFPAEMSRRTRDAVRGLVASFRFVVLDGSSWESSDAEPNGIGRNAYRWLERAAGRLERTRVGFESAAEFADIGGAPGAVGEARASLDASVGWIVDANYAETMGKVAGGMLPVSGRSHGSLKLVRRELVATRTFGADDWNRTWEGLQASTTVESNGDPLAFERKFWSERLKGMTLSFLMSNLELLCRAPDPDTKALVAARTDLQWMLRLDPRLVDDVDALVATVDPAAAQILLAAVGRIGDDRCQAVLLRNASDPGRQDDVRAGSLYAMVGVAHPNATTLAGLSRLFAPGTNDPARPTALLVAGALAGLTDEGDAIIPALLDAKPTADDPLLLADWMTALGNTKNDQVKDVVAQYLNHTDVAVATAAQAAFENVTAAP
ncbi:MAG: hypothetical protein JNL94_09905 [Planctomycetes bacterium]|nr:hypothetical protein [Planctomycetota bacterium]